MSRLLLDTHAALFWWSGADRLSGAARDAIGDGDTVVFVSAASAWEIATKFRIRKLDFAGDPQSRIPQLMIDHDFAPLSVTVEHALRAGALPGDHRDPFDRLIAAQALVDDLTVITRDAQIAGFGCKVIW